MIKINVLGVEYSIKESNQEKDPRLKECCGFYDETTKTIVVDDFIESANDPMCKDDLKHYKNKVIRHEIVHAFLQESGLAINSTNGWAVNEEIVDWIAIQMPKIFEVCKQINVL